MTSGLPHETFWRVSQAHASAVRLARGLDSFCMEERRVNLPPLVGAAPEGELGLDACGTAGRQRSQHYRGSCQHRQRQSQAP